MAHYNLIVKGGDVVSSTGVSRADVGVVDGTITAVADLGGDATADRVVDAAGQFVLPGVIDSHVHPVYEDDLARASRAGASGGVTTIIAFVAAFPSWGFPKTTPSAVVEEYIRTWDGKPMTDFALHVAFDNTDDSEAEVPKLIDLGVTSFKFFMAYPRRNMMVDDAHLITGLEAVGKAGGVAAVHAENGSGIDHLESQYWDDDEVDNSRFLECHTHLFETEAVLRVIALAEAVGCPLYIPHLAVAEGIDVVQLARKTARVPVWVETCPHYLELTNDEVIKRGALSKIAPPIRLEKDNERLWAALADKDVQTVGTDHGAQTIERKAKGKNVLQAPYGAEGIEHLLPLVYGRGVAAGRIDIQRLAAVLAENPADIFGLDKKGRIAVGKDADIVVLDPAGHTKCTIEDHVSTGDYCLYEGHEMPGHVRYTIRRGELMLDDGKLAENGTGGKFLKRVPIGKRPLPLVDGIVANA